MRKKIIMFMVVLSLLFINGCDLFETGAIVPSQCNRCDPNNIGALNNDLFFCEQDHGYSCTVTGGCLVCDTDGGGDGTSCSSLGGFCYYPSCSSGGYNSISNGDCTVDGYSVGYECCGDCDSQDDYKCYGNAIWWYDSCGNRESVKESCTYGCDYPSTSCNSVDCTDSDGGKNAYTKGTTTGLWGTTISTKTDFCTSSETNSVQEFSCSDGTNFPIGTMVQSKVMCDGGDICENGACKSSGTCTDSDGQNFKIRGYVILDGSQNFDVCIDDLLLEQICVGSERQVVQKDCKDFGSDWVCNEVDLKGACVEEVPTGKTWKGFCLNKQNNCRYIDRTYTELQQIKGTYDSYECMKPSFPDLYSTQTECEANREKEITCYTQCVNGHYEEKIVTTVFCSDKGLLSIPPSDCISPEAKGCTYLGKEYDAGEQFCYQGNVGRCMGDEKIDIIIYCDVDCEDSKCTEKVELGKVCCRTWGLTTTKEGQLTGTYYYNKEDECPIGLNIKEVSMDYCTGEKDPEDSPEVDEETEEGTPEEREGIEKCSLSLGSYCKPTNVPGTWDDSSPHNLCKSGWCQDLRETGLGGRCAKVGKMKDGKVESGFEPHQDCAEIAKEAYGLDLCKWTTWAPEWFGTQCATAYTIIIGGLIVLIIISQLGGKK